MAKWTWALAAALLAPAGGWAQDKETSPAAELAADAMAKEPELDVSKMPPHPELRNQTFPLVWAKPYGKGRVLYSSFGHDASIYDNRDIALMFLEGMKWVLGLTEGDITPRAPKGAAQ